MKKLTNLVGMALSTALLAGCNYNASVENLNGTSVRPTESEFERPIGTSVYGLNGTSVREAQEGYPRPAGTSVEGLNGTPVR